MREGGWQTTTGLTLSGKTLGLLGLGRIGKRMTEYAKVFGMEVIAWSQNLTEEAAAADLGKVRLAPEKGQNSVRYFTDWALPQLDLLLPENTEPIEVWTTLDPALQNAAIARLWARAAPYAKSMSLPCSQSRSRRLWNVLNTSWLENPR